MGSGSLKLKFWSNSLLLLSWGLAVATPDAAAQLMEDLSQQKAPEIKQVSSQKAETIGEVEGQEQVPFDYLVTAGGAASTQGGFGPHLGFDVASDTLYTMGLYEGGLFPHASLSAEALPGLSPLWLFSLGAEFLTNFNSNSFGLRNAWVHGYREVFRENPVFFEGNFLGVIPYFFSGFRWRTPWGYIQAQWVPFEILRGTRDLMSFYASGARGSISATLAQRHVLTGRIGAGALYTGTDGFTRTASLGFHYMVESEYHFRINKKLRLGVILGVEGALASVRDSVTAATEAWSLFGFQSSLFVTRTF